MAFHPYPQLIRAVFNLQRFGPPRRLTGASPWPWIDHSVSRLLCGTCALFRLAFASAAPLKGLTWHHTTTRRLIMQKARRHPGKPELRPLVSTRFQVLFHSPSRRSFHLSLTVLVHYRSWSVFSLGGWCRRLQTGFLRSRPTQGFPPSTPPYVYGTLTLYGRPFQRRSSSALCLAVGPSTPAGP